MVVYALLLVTSLSGTAYAHDNVNQLIPEPPIIEENDGIIIQGAKPPKSDASTHDLSSGAYNYTVEEVGYRVYTNKWLKGAKKFKVTVKNWERIEATGGIINDLTIAVLDNKGSVKASKTIDPTEISSVTLSGLSSSTKYYVRFEVPINGNKYSFNGKISKAD